MLCLPDAAFYERFPSTYQRPRAYNISLTDIALRSTLPLARRAPPRDPAADGAA